MAIIVFVHGAFHGGWCWEGVARELERRGTPSLSLDLPLTGFADDVEVARSEMASVNGPAVVCAHSYGGLVISAAATGLPSVKHLVYLAAIKPEPGEDIQAATLSYPTFLAESLLIEDGNLVVKPEAAHQAMYGDSNAAEAARCVARLRPMPLEAPEIFIIDEPAWRSVPFTFVVCANDQAVHPEQQRRMAQGAHAVVEWPTDHSPFLTRPDVVADLLQTCAENADSQVGRPAAESS